MYNYTSMEWTRHVPFGLQHVLCFIEWNEKHSIYMTHFLVGPKKNEIFLYLVTI